MDISPEPLCQISPSPIYIYDMHGKYRVKRDKIEFFLIKITKLFVLKFNGQNFKELSHICIKMNKNCNCSL